MDDDPRHQSGFRDAILRLVQDGIYIAVALLIEWGIIELIDLTLGHDTHAMVVIIDGIKLASGIGAIALWLMHAVRGLVDYWQFKPQPSGERGGAQ